MADDIGLLQALKESEKQEERVEPVEEQDPEVIAMTKFIKFVNADRARRYACIGPPDPPKVLDLNSVFPSGEVVK